MVDPHFDDLYDVTFFVPCLNEEMRVTGALQTTKAAMDELKLTYEILVVDDGSQDKTFEVASAFQRQNPGIPIKVFRNEKNMGLGRNFVDAAFQGRGRYYFLVCGDNVIPKETIVATLALLGKVNLVIPHYPTIPGKSASRLLLSKLYTTLVNMLSGYRLKYYNGCVLYRRYHVMRWAPYNYGFGYQADLLTILLDEGVSYEEVPLKASHCPKTGKRSPITLRNSLSTLHTLLTIFIRRIRNVIYG